MNELFDMKHGISIRGKEYGFVGISDAEIDDRVDDMLDFIQTFKGSAGGTFGETIEACIDFPYEDLTLEKFTDFEKNFRIKYPTFDGHIYLHDINHFTSEESKFLDSYSEDSFLEDDYDEGDDWKIGD
jgi:hypothetical protein